MSTHQVTRLSISIDQPYEVFSRRFNEAVPPFNATRLSEFVERRASWDVVVADANAAAPFGFFIFWHLDVTPSMALNGNATKCCEYLMGNNTIAERMFRVDPTAMLYVPLRIVVYEQPGDRTTFVIETPSSTLSSLARPEIDAVAAELNQKLVTLFGHLNMLAPPELEELIHAR